MDNIGNNNLDKTGNNKRFDGLGKTFAMLAATSILTGWILLWKGVSITLVDSVLPWVRDVSIYTTVVFSILEAFTEKDRSYVWYFFILMIAILLILVIAL